MARFTSAFRRPCSTGKIRAVLEMSGKGDTFEIMPTSINPATEEHLAEYDKMTHKEVQTILASTADSFRAWSNVPVEKRAELIHGVSKVLNKRREELARLITREMGKPIREARSEIEKCAWVCRYYAENGPRFIADERVDSDASMSYISYKPLGVVLAVMPWNFPFWQVFRFAAPGLTAGNGVILKHASNVTGCSLALESIFIEAGFPEDIFRVVITDAEEIEKVIASPHIQAITLTGSGPAGSAVAGAAGKSLKKSVLELGGSDPYLILSDADLDEAATVCAKSRLLNGGQSCIAAKRFIVLESVEEAFTEKFLAKITSTKVGDPEDEETDMGPMARKDLREEIHEQVSRSIKQGANLHCGGSMPEGKGFYYPPTVLSNVQKGMPAYDEEVFGPVASIIKAGNVEEAVRIANDSKFGLGSAVFTRDLESARRVARNLVSGVCAINDMVKSDPRQPFGGVRQSGFGRELSSQGMREFVNLQTVVVK